MTTHNADNERIKRRYFAYLKEAKRHSEPTVDAVAKALARYEVDTKHRAFKKFHSEQAIAFKRRVAEQRNQQTGEKLSKATLNATLAHVKRFFHWLAGQPGYKSRLQYSDADYFNLVLSRISNDPVKPLCGSRSLAFHRAAHGDRLHRHLQFPPRAHGSIGFQDPGGCVLRGNDPCIRPRHGATMPAR